MLKKQLGEEVFERRRMENEIREMKRICADFESVKIGTDNDDEKLW